MKKKLKKNRRIINLEIIFSVGFILFSIVLSIAFYFFLSNLHAKILQDHLVSIASTATLKINGDDLAKIQTKNDMQKIEFKNLVSYLSDVKKANTNIRFVYIMRQTDKNNYLSFITDADALSNFNDLDLNKNGKVDSWEETSYPGDLYDISQMPQMREAFNAPTADKEITVDQWGKLISGYAPIYDSSGHAVAILGVDILADDYYKVQARSAVALFILLIIFFLMLAIFFVVMRQYRKEIKILEEIDKQKSDFISLASHQLRTPLSASKWGIHMLQQGDFGGLAEKQQKIVKNLYNVNEKMVVLVNDLLRISHLDSEDLKVKFAKINIEEICKAALHEVEFMRQQKNIIIKLNLDKRFKILKTDKTLLQEILINLLTNAIKYTALNGRVELEVKQERSRVLFRVSDNGVGIPRREQLRIFSKFFRASNIIKKDLNGTGLGLYFVKKAIDLLGGRIDFSSEENIGTVFYFYLPQEKNNK
jgi:signal transduction histidine kinase